MTWKLSQDPEWPFYLTITDTDGSIIVSQTPYGYSTKAKTVGDVMSAVGFPAKDRDTVAAANAKQLQQIKLMAAAQNMETALRTLRSMPYSEVSNEAKDIIDDVLADID